MAPIMRMARQDYDFGILSPQLSVLKYQFLALNPNTQSLPPKYEQSPGALFLVTFGRLCIQYSIHVNVMIKYKH